MRLPRRPATTGLFLTGALVAGLSSLAPLCLERAAAEGDDKTPKKREVVAFPVGQEFPDFEAKDLDGAAFRLSAARTIDKDVALAAVAGAAKAAGAKETGRETALDTVEAWKEADARVTGLQKAVTPYGLIVSAERAGGWKTLGDVADWIAASSEAPMVFLVWSSKCPTSKEYEPRIQEIVAKTGVRFFPLAANAMGETDAEAKGFIEGKGLPYRVLLDRDQAVCDRLGGLRTPHVFVLDKKNRLRYAGAIDDDPSMEKEDTAARRNYLLEAIEQVQAGKEVAILTTMPKG